MVCDIMCHQSPCTITRIGFLKYRIAGYFANSQFNSCLRKVISRMEIMNRASSTLIIYTVFNLYIINN